jgi:hypothetical protein
MSLDIEPHPHGRVCKSCARKLADQLVSRIQDGSLDLGKAADLGTEQLLQIFLAGAVALAEKLPGTEADLGKYLFREMAVAFLESGPRLPPNVLADVPVDPELPPDFDSTPNDARPAGHAVWWDRPYIVTNTLGDGHTEGTRAAWLAVWPSGTRYDVRCLDGGAWDRSTSWGSFATLDEAIARARQPGPYPRTTMAALGGRPPFEEP